MQIVFISRRPEVLGDTIKQVRRFMPFIDATVIACPEAVSHDMAAIQADALTVVTDQELLGDSNAGLTDHQKRNASLRSRLIANPVVQEMFVMSDDDSRPMREIPRETFIEGGRYHNYYFYELSQWPGNRTDFDRGQHNTCVVLDVNGYSRLSYASHMPQIIDRAIFLEAMETFSTAMSEYALCEWSLYFNYALKKHQGKFHEPRPFRTLCWPDYPEVWPFYVQPLPLQFENYYPCHYDAGQIFHGLQDCPTTEDAERVALAKLVRWRRVCSGRRALMPDRYDPWRRHLFSRPFFCVARFLLRVVRLFRIAQ